ncbi:MAG: hypothetical protein HQM14_06355 [SAR324 cluster bacterium]|nr:hypothetical protein [SAR324 cluster bacterium]
MAKEKKTHKTKASFSWQILLSVGVIAAGVIAFMMLQNSPDPELDLSIIKKGENVVVQVHDPL